MSRTQLEWTSALDAGGPVDLTAGDRLVARVDGAGVLLTEHDLVVPWVHLGWAFGESTTRFSLQPGSLDLYVSRTWWTDDLGREPLHPDPRGAWEALLSTSFTSFRRPVPAEEFGEWLTGEAVRRAPLPARLALTPSPEDPVFDRDTSRRVPLDRLPISHSLRADVAAWGAAAADVPELERSDDATWDRFWPTGRELAARLEQETGRPSAVWADCPEVP